MTRNTFTPATDDKTFAMLLNWLRETDAQRHEAFVVSSESAERINENIHEFGSFSPETRAAQEAHKRDWQAFAELDLRVAWLYGRLCEFANSSNYELPESLLLEALR